MRLDVTGAHQHHHLDNLIHLVVHLEQAEFGDATDLEELARGDWWIFPPSNYDTIHHSSLPDVAMSWFFLRVCRCGESRVGVTRGRRWPDRRISACFGGGCG